MSWQATDMPYSDNQANQTIITGMEPDHSYYTDEVTRSKRLRFMLDVLIVLLVLLCAGLVWILLFGYGSVRIAGLPAGATVTVNGRIVTEKTLKLRPGTYTVGVSSPLITPLSSTVTVPLLRTITYTPHTIRRSPDAIASSVIGTMPGTSEAVQLADTQWFSNDTWVAGKSSDGYVLALHYDSSQKHWTVAYYNAVASYPTDLSTLPDAISVYVQQLEAAHA